MVRHDLQQPDKLAGRVLFEFFAQITEEKQVKMLLTCLPKESCAGSFKLYGTFFRLMEFMFRAFLIDKKMKSAGYKENILGIVPVSPFKHKRSGLLV